MQEWLNNGGNDNVVAIHYPWLTSVQSTLDKIDSNAKVLALIEWRSISFRKPLEKVEDMEGVLKWLKNKWVKDLLVRNLEWDVIEDFEEVIWLDTFIFSFEAVHYITIAFRDYFASKIVCV